MINFLKIINYLGKNIPQGFTMHELSKLTKLPYASFYRYVHHLAEQKVLFLESIGKAKVVKLNLDHPVQNGHLTNASFEEMCEYISKNPIIKKIVNELKTKEIVLLFGSYAKGKQTQKSDIDLLIINETGEKSLDFSKYEVLYKIDINPIFIKESEFQEMLIDYEENVGKQALKNHIILNNPDKFWRLVTYELSRRV